MRVSVVGAGYVGLVSAACFAELGNEVACVDIDDRKVALLNSGRVPIHEPGLSEVLDRNIKQGRIRFTSRMSHAVDHGDVIFIAVGTPSGEDGSADLTHVLAVGKAIGEFLHTFKVIVTKSTVPVGTCAKIEALIRRTLDGRGIDTEFAVASNPEFLREGSALEDFMKPDRVVIGVDETATGNKAREVLAKLYDPVLRGDGQLIAMDIRSSELTKYAANAMLATRISFMNELSQLAEMVDADIEFIKAGLGSDRRIGTKFLNPGIGYGGSCFPKDVRALVKMGHEYGLPQELMAAVDRVNERQKLTVAQKIADRFGRDLSGLTFGLWGLAFKPNTDDMREAPSRSIIKALVDAGAHIRAYDPVARKEAERVLLDDFGNDRQEFNRIAFVETASEAYQGADALLLLTEWELFKATDFEAVMRGMRQPILFDGRNLYNPHEMKAAGFEYYSVGRSHLGGLK